jgi:cell division protein ZapA
MNTQVKPITVTIMDKEYVVGATEDEREALFATVEYLNRKLREQRDSGKVIGSERVAVMAALNIAHEYLDYRRRNDSAASDIGAGIQRIQSKINSALSRGKPNFELATPSHHTN